MIELNRIYLGDCLEVMKDIPDKSVDLVLTDPPYNVDKDYNEYKDDLDIIQYGKWCFDWFYQLQRISNTVLITIGTVNQNLWNGISVPTYKYIWYKDNTTQAGKFSQMALYEPIYFYGSLIKKPKKDLFRCSIVLQKAASFHVCPKPLKLWKDLIDNFSNPSQTVLDIFSGSGTTAIACLELNRNFICIEKDPKYYELSVKRVNDYKSQVPMEFLKAI